MRRAWLEAGFAVLASAGSAQPPAGKAIADLDVAAALGAPPGWRFVARQGPDVPDPVGLDDGEVPGEVRLCLTRRADACDLPLAAMPARSDPEVAAWWSAHFLEEARIVRPAGRGALLLRTASLHGGNGDQAVLTQLIAWDAGAARFAPVFAHDTGRNNNQEVRYMGAGPLEGAVVVAEPTGDAPFAYWIGLHRPDPALRYRQALRYRSATRYGDGNPLAVIDSEMPGLLRRLGLWRPGAPLPVPVGRRCPAPRLVRGALWCA